MLMSRLRTTECEDRARILKQNSQLDIQGSDVQGSDIRGLSTTRMSVRDKQKHIWQMDLELDLEQLCGRLVGTTFSSSPPLSSLRVPLPLCPVFG